MRTTLLCAALATFLPVLAHAQSTASAIADFGLLGTWAGECRESANPNNNHATYASTSSGGVQLRYQAGEGYQDSIYDIVEAKRLTPDRLSMRQVLIGNESVTLEIVLLKQNDQIPNLVVDVPGWHLARGGRYPAIVCRPGNPLDGTLLVSCIW